MFTLIYIITNTRLITYYIYHIIMLRLIYTHTACSLLLNLIFVFRWTYTHTVCHLLLRPYQHVQTNIHTYCLQLTHQTLSLYSDWLINTLSITYSWDLILMFWLTYHHTMPIIDLYIVLYLMDIMEIRTHLFYFIFVCQNNHDFRISFSTTFAIGDYCIDPKSDIICKAKVG